MANLSAEYLGLQLRNPIIAASSNLTATVKKIIACERAGIGAVVVKSLFEEQVRRETGKLMERLDSSGHPEAHDLLKNAGDNYVLDEYLKVVEEAKRRVQIPVIASLSCVTIGNWVEYARRLENVGADAIELNLYLLGDDPNEGGREVERRYAEIVRRVRKATNLPLAVKLSQHLSGIAETVESLNRLGANGVVLFNRFYRPDIDIETLKVIPSKLFTHGTESATTLHWIGLLSGRVKANLAAATGIHDAAGIIKQLLAGASVVQLCTTFYENGIDHAQQLLAELSKWMERHQFAAIADFRGLLSKARCPTPEMYERTQYVHALAGVG